MDDLNQVLRIRREKLDAIRERGIEPFAYNYDPSHQSTEAVGAFEAAEAAESLSEDGDGASVRIAGRIVSWRGHGKSAFAHVEDATGQVQLYFRKNVLGDESFADLISLGERAQLAAGPSQRKAPQNPSPSSRGHKREERSESCIGSWLPVVSVRP